MNKYKNFLSWILITNILYIISNYISTKVVSASNGVLMIVYDILITIGILYIIYRYISKTVPLKKILQKHYKLFIIVFIVLLITDNVIKKYILTNPYLYIQTSSIPYETLQIIGKFIYNNLQISLIYILILFLNQKMKNTH